MKGLLSLVIENARMVKTITKAKSQMICAWRWGLVGRIVTYIRKLISNVCNEF